MIHSFLTITLRILWKNKFTSFVNIIGLTIGITAFILIMLYVQHEFSIDRFNKHYDKIYRLQTENYAKFPPIIGEHIKEKVPEIENIARIVIVGNGKEYISYSDPGSMEMALKVQCQSYFADSTVFDVFTLPFVQGEPGSALKDPFTIVLTESTAHKLFADKNPIGETVQIGDQAYMVTGIIEDVKNSHINIEALKSYESFFKLHANKYLNRIEAGSQLWSATYILLSNKADSQFIKEKINHVLEEINDVSLFMIEFQEFDLLALGDVYFNGSTANLQFGKQGNQNLVRTFLAIAFFILALAGMNYVNLTTTRASLRAKEVALKKIVGSSTKQLQYQFIFESILTTLISFVLAVSAVLVILPQFSRMTSLNISVSSIGTVSFWLFSIIGILVIGTFSGLYPAFHLTRINSISLMEGQSFMGARGAVLRQVFFIFQFTISTVLIIGIITNLRQLNYARNMDMGYNMEQIIYFNTPNSPRETKHELRKTLKERLLQNPNIQMISFTTGGRMGTGLRPAPEAEFDGVKTTGVVYMVIDPDYLDLMGHDIIDGRGFSWDITWDRNISMIFNETAAKIISSDADVVVKIGYYQNPYKKDAQLHFEIIGVVEDFHFLSVHHKIEPMCFAWYGPEEGTHIKISPNNIHETVRFIEKEWKNMYGTAPFEYAFLDDLFDQQYKNDENGARIIAYFTLLAIIIACMGLFALSSFVAVRRTKEIGIRKTLGASAESIFYMLSREFIKWVFIAALIAGPIAWFIMHKWLEGFAYHISLGIDIFFLAIFIALTVALVTVAWQSIKSALTNPVEALRDE